MCATFLLTSVPALKIITNAISKLSFLSFAESCVFIQAFQILQNLFYYLDIRKLIQKDNFLHREIRLGFSFHGKR